MDKLEWGHLMLKPKNRILRGLSSESFYRQRKRRHGYLLDEQLRKQFQDQGNSELCKPGTHIILKKEQWLIEGRDGIGSNEQVTSE